MGDYNSAPSRGFVWGAVIATLIVVAVLAFIFKVVTPAGPTASTPGSAAASPTATAPAADTAAGTRTGGAGTSSAGTDSARTGAASTADQAQGATGTQAGGDTQAAAPQQDQDPADEGGTAQAAASEETQMMQVAFTGESGEALYVQACQSCHMPGGRGAEGAGRYPALANNARVTSTPYVTSIILNGKGGMPGFGHYLDDQQIAMIVNYVRGDLNGQDSNVQPQEIEELRPENPNYLIFGESAG